jgi:transposase
MDAGMARREGPVHVVTTTRHYGGKVYQTHLLRRSYRDGGTVRNETLGNLSHLPDPLIALIRRSLKGEAFVPAADAFEVTQSRLHGHVHAVALAMQRLDVAKLLAARACQERDLVLAMIAARILAPQTKLATVRWWANTTLPETFGVEDADEQQLYAAMDWLLERQDRIQKKLAARHLEAGAMALYDLSSSYYEGATCPLARRGYSRDRKKGTLQVNYGLLTDSRGCPVAISVHAGDTADPVTLAPEIDRLKGAFAIDRFVIVADRGMISQKAVEDLKTNHGVDWISALKTTSIRTLVEAGQIQLDLFDERNLFEATSPDYPGERLIACRNLALARLRAHKRADMLAATEANLLRIQARVAAGRLSGRDKIALAVGKIVNQYKMAKHIQLDIGDDSFTFTRNRDKIAAEAALDGVYVIRTSLPAERMSAPDCVRSYKSLSRIERAFRTLKSVDLKIRPIHHRLADRVRAHLVLCMLAYYVEWHMREAWREIMFADEDQEAKATRDPVAPAQRSAKALRKVHTRHLDDGSPTHSFSTLLAELATITRNTCRTPGADAADPHNTPSFQLTTTASPQQRRAYDLIQTITP